MMLINSSHTIQKTDCGGVVFFTNDKHMFPSKCFDKLVAEYFFFFFVLYRHKKTYEAKVRKTFHQLENGRYILLQNNDSFFYRSQHWDQSTHNRFRIFLFRLAMIVGMVMANHLQQRSVIDIRISPQNEIIIRENLTSLRNTYHWRCRQYYISQLRIA